MLKFGDRFPPPWFYEEHHDRIIIGDVYGAKLLTIHVEVGDHPGKRVHKFPAVTMPFARSLALAIENSGLQF
jgi:hypothetical protein